MTEKEILLEARQRLAAQYRQTYHLNAILSGDWDTGVLISAKIAEIRAEAGNRSDKRKPK